MKKKVYIYKAYERFWHWTQAFLVFFLAFTGFEIFGFRNAVIYHNAAAVSFMILIVFTIFWHFTTGEWKQYVPTTKNIKAQILYYAVGMFKNAPHPVHKTELSKLNPLQRIVYFLLKVVFIPLMVISGLLYMFYRYPHNGNIVSINTEGLTTIAVLHTLGAFIMIAFVVVHLYLITTGTTIFTNLKAMLTGYEEIEEESKI
jgi:thiosulfate reductase cytochrome b subunit